MAISRRRVVAGAAAGGLVPHLAWAADDGVGMPVAPKVLRYAFEVAETSLDPAKINDLYSRTLTPHIFEGLYTYDHLARPVKIKPLTADGRAVHQVGVPIHWGANGLSTGDSANDLAHLALDPNVHIQEVKALACDIRPGRRPRGPALRELVRGYARRAGITDDTGTEV